MAQATANRVALRYVEEASIGEIPSNPALQLLRTTGDALTSGATFITSDEITANRLVSDTVQTEATSGGTISGELSYGTYDAFLEGLLGSTWVPESTPQTLPSGATLAVLESTTGKYALATTTDFFTEESYPTGSIILIEGASRSSGNIYAIVADTPAVSARLIPIHPFRQLEPGQISAIGSRNVTRLSYLRNGSEDKSYTIQKHFQDIDPQVYWNFRGSRVSTLGLELATGSILTAEFGFETEADAITNAQLSGATLVNPNNNTVLNAVNNVASILRDNNANLEETFFSSLSIGMDNNYRRQLAIGQLDAIGVAAGRLSLTGSIEYYFNNRRLVDDFKAAREYSLNFLLNDTDDAKTGGNSLIVSMPRVKNESLDIPTTGIDTDIFASADFQALGKGSGTNAYSLQFSRRPAA